MSPQRRVGRRPRRPKLVAPRAVSFETLVGELAVFDSDYHTLALWAAGKWAAVRRIPKGIA